MKTNEIRFYSIYKGLWYKYIKENNMWEIADNKYGSMYLWKFNAEAYRIDECFDDIFKQLKQEPMYFQDLKLNNSEYILDWNLDSGILWLNENNIEYRITCRDGNNYVTINDFKVERVNLEIENKKIINITYG